MAASAMASVALHQDLIAYPRYTSMATSGHITAHSRTPPAGLRARTPQDGTRGWLKVSAMRIAFSGHTVYAQLATLAQPLIDSYLSLCCHSLSGYSSLQDWRGYVTSKRGAVQSVFRVLAKVLRIRYLKQSDFLKQLFTANGCSLRNGMPLTHFMGLLKIPVREHEAQHVISWYHSLIDEIMFLSCTVLPPLKS
ncbi:MAG: hypothetical protein MZU95_09530 [Desulfomicrobium escambiense]|nr:hypothetical protein [Desulfomicrobium escambiense]